MKVYGVYSTDNWETRTSENYIGIFSTPELARKQVLDNIDSDTKIVIEEIVIDEVDSGAKMEVYSFESGLKFKSISSDAQYGSFAMATLDSDYYEVKNFSFEKRLIPTIVDSYMKYMQENNLEPEIEYLNDNEFLELDENAMSHVLYHAEIQKNLKLKNFFQRLNQA